MTKARSNATAPAAKGEIVVGTGSELSGILSVGANGTVLTANSATATGLEWAAPAAGGLTLLSTTTLSGASTTISSIDQSYVDLMVIVEVPNSSVPTTINMRINGSTNPNYGWLYRHNTNGTVADSNGFLTTEIQVPPNGGFNGGQWGINRFVFTQYATPTRQRFCTMDGFFLNSSSQRGWYFGSAGITETAALTSLTFFVSSGTMTQGTVKIYGVK